MSSVCIVGASGRMGKAITALLPDSTKSYLYSRLSNDNVSTFVRDVQTCDGVIDISHPDNIAFALEACVKAKKPYMCGTTGLTQSHFDALKAASASIPVLYAANTSLGIAILKKAVALVSKTLGESADITISETHHRMKKDAPSGTALELGKVIAQTGRPEESIDFTSLRGGNIPGEHTVYFFSSDETISLSHKCLNRNVFADGAIKAGMWVFKQPPGFYGLNDMLGLS